MQTTCQAPKSKVAARSWRVQLEARRLAQQMADAEKLAAQAERLGHLKRRARVTFREIADSIHVTERQVQRWFAGESEIGGDNLKLLADYLETTPDFIEYGERDAPNLLASFSPSEIQQQLDRIDQNAQRIGAIEQAIHRLTERQDSILRLINERLAASVLEAIQQSQAEASDTPPARRSEPSTRRRRAS